MHDGDWHIKDDPKYKCAHDGELIPVVQNLKMARHVSKSEDDSHSRWRYLGGVILLRVTLFFHVAIRRGGDFLRVWHWCNLVSLLIGFLYKAETASISRIGRIQVMSACIIIRLIIISRETLRTENVSRSGSSTRT